MRIVVTGGAGFIGRWVVDALHARREEVVVLDDFSNGSEQNIKEFMSSKSFEVVRGDVADPRAVARAFERRVDSCVHLAASIEVQKSILDPMRSFQVNTMGTAHVLEACRAADVPLTIVSTCMVYDMATPDGAIAEDHPVRPASPYASSKLAAEYLALSYHRTYGLPVSVLRPFNTYGPYQKANQEGGVVSIFVARALRGEALQVFGDGTQTRDFLYVDDCVDLILRASSDRRAAGQVLNGGSGRELAINDLARLIAGPDGKIVHVPHPHPQSEIRRLRSDNSRAAKLLGWRPRVPLEEGIARLRRWMAA